MKRRDSSGHLLLPIVHTWQLSRLLSVTKLTLAVGACQGELHAELSAESLSSVGFISNHATASSLKRLAPVPGR
jgi:hypothetical protein